MKEGRVSLIAAVGGLVALLLLPVPVAALTLGQLVPVAPAAPAAAAAQIAAPVAAPAAAPVAVVPGSPVAVVPWPSSPAAAAPTINPKETLPELPGRLNGVRPFRRSDTPGLPPANGFESIVDAVWGDLAKVGIQAVAPPNDKKVDTQHGSPLVPPHLVKQLVNATCLENMARDPQYVAGPECYGMAGPAPGPAPAPGCAAASGCAPAPAPASMHDATAVAEKVAKHPSPFEAAAALPKKLGEAASEAASDVKDAAEDAAAASDAELAAANVAL